MSSDPALTSRRTATEAKTSTASRPATEEKPYADCLAGVDARFRHLKNDLFPDSPYYLTVPTDRPFHLGNRFVSNWAVGADTVFAPEEEHLQYMTFLSHQNEDTLLVAVGGWADARGNIMPEEEPPKPTTASQKGGPKKKITLSDYKKKAQQGPAPKQEDSSSAAKDEAVSLKKGPAEQYKQQATQMSTPVEAPSSKLNGQLETSAGTKGHEEKPNRPEERLATPDKTATPPKRKISNEEGATVSKKRLRLSTEQQPESKQHSEKSKEQGPSLPELLSPTLPPSIPTLLSPTLPAGLEDELASLPPEKPRASTESLSKNKKPVHSTPSLTSTTGKAELPRPKPTETGRPHSGSTSSGCSKTTNKSTSANANSLDPAAAPKLKSKDQNSSTSAQPAQRRPSTTRPAAAGLAPAVAKTSSHPSSHTKSSARAGRTSNSRLIVKLKYGRQNRKRVEALLKFSGKLKAQSESSVPKQRTGASSTSLNKSEGPQPTSSASKPAKQRQPSSGHKRTKEPEPDDLPEPATKRQRSSTATSDRPRTPTIQVTKPSPTTAASNKQFLPPSKGVKGVALRRVGSGDSHTSTPGATSSQDGVSGADKPAQPPPKSTDGQASNKPPAADNRRAWRDEFHKFTALGRDLKHAASRYTANNNDNNDNNKDKDTTTTTTTTTTTDAKLAATTGVEAILCFILAFLADDQFRSLARQVPDSTNWRSIIAYWHVVTNGAAAYPHLHGLCLFLGAVSREAIHGLDLERLAVSAVPGEHSPAPTPGSDGNTVTSEESKQYKREFTDLKSRLPESYREANRLWLAGSRELSDDVLARQYPNTWSHRSKNYFNRGSEKMEVGRYSGEYFLPLGRGGGTTTSLEAVRFGLSFLKEWCETEGVQWKATLTL